MGPTRLLAALLLIAAFAAGCGDDDDDSGNGGNDGGGESASATVDINATDFKFDPANPTVDKTGTVKFRLTNDGEAPHALEIEGPSGEAETEEIPPGQSTTLDVDLSKAGEYTMYCPVGNHRQMGMEGKVIVGEGGGSSSSGSGDDTEKKEDRGGYGY